MALDSNALVTLADTKTYLQISDTKYDTILEMLINAVSTMFDNYVGFQIKKKTYTDLLLDGNGAVEFWLPFYPVTNITSLKEIDSDGSEETLTEGKNNDYIVDEDKGLLIRRDTVWIDDYDSIKISCDGGYETIPKDLQQACFLQVAASFQKFKNKTWGEGSRTFPDGSISILETELLSEVKVILNKYRRVLL